MNWILLACGSAFFAGITAVLAKIGITGVNSNLATALRTVVVLLFSWLMVFITGAQTGLQNIEPHSLTFLILSGLATGASWLCYFKALQLGNVNRVAPVDKSSTVLTVLLAFLFLGEPITLYKGIGICGIALGTWLMIEKKTDTEEKSKSWLVYALLSAVFASLTSILGKVGITGIDSNLGTAIRTIVVLVMAWGIVFAQKTEYQIRDIDRKSWTYLILSGITTGLSWLCFYAALQTGPASVVLPIDKLSILVTIAFSWIILKEKLSARSAIGLVILTAGTLCMLL
ncbi:MAG: EamA family transporter [Eubacteriaceae bacterium]